MNKFPSIFLLGFTILLFSCQSKVDESGEFNLLPYPQQFEISGASKLKCDDLLQYYFDGEFNLPGTGSVLENIQQAAKESEAQIICRMDDSLDLPAEGYTMDITKNKVDITAKDRAGLLYAFMTLEQLAEDAKDQDVPLPICNIMDFPLLPYRAIHLDVKHHREQPEYYYKMLDKLAKYKVNAIIAEMEDKLKYERQPGVGSADAFTIDDWKHLSEYALERNIEISPLIQGLGHASFILKHEKYMHLRDDPERDWAFNPLDPETYEVQFDLYRDALEATPYGRYLHVGGDEVHTTGRGSGLSTLELQLKWLNRVCDFAEENGRIPIFWDDMPLKYAGVYRTMYNLKLTEEEVNKTWEDNEHKLLEFLDQFPENCVYMRWNYSTPQTPGNAKAMEWFHERGFQVMGATAGQTRWVLMPQEESNIDNIRSFALSSIDKGLNGLLLTLWDDDSPHFELYWRGIIAFAEYTWSGEKRTKEKVKSAYRQREYSPAFADGEFAFIDQLEGPVAFWKNALLKRNQRNKLQTLNNPITEAVIDLPGKNDKGKWTEKHASRLKQAKEAIADCDEVVDKITHIKSHAVRNNFTLEIYQQVNELARFAPKALLALQAYDTAENEQDESEALENIKRLPEEFMNLREKLEQVYSMTRILMKPEGYILDQDHHTHLANQTISFDWQFGAEILFLEKIQNQY